VGKGGGMRGIKVKNEEEEQRMRQIEGQRGTDSKYRLATNRHILQQLTGSCYGDSVNKNHAMRETIDFCHPDGWQNFLLLLMRGKFAIIISDIVSPLCFISLLKSW
jgi:hypothetical protein